MYNPGQHPIRKVVPVAMGQDNLTANLRAMPEARYQQATPVVVVLAMGQDILVGDLAGKAVMGDLLLRP